MPYSNLHQVVQLHEGIEIYYVVDGYMATLTTQDGDRVVAKVYGETIEAALQLLDTSLEGKTLAQVRAMKAKEIDIDREGT